MIYPGFQGCLLARFSLCPGLTKPVMWNTRRQRSNGAASDVWGIRGNLGVIGDGLLARVSGHLVLGLKIPSLGNPLHMGNSPKRKINRINLGKLPKILGIY